MLGFVCCVHERDSGLQSGECRPFIVDGQQVGVIRPDVLKQLFKYPEVFVIRDNEKAKVVELSPAFRDYDERTEHVDRVLRQLRQDNVFFALKGWRDEVRILIGSLCASYRVYIIDARCVAQTISGFYCVIIRNSE